jgi:membrane-associated phospholipid phosphatase
VAAAGDQDPAAARGRRPAGRRPVPARPAPRPGGNGPGEAILTGEDEVRLAAPPPGPDSGDRAGDREQAGEREDADDAVAGNVGQADLAPESADKTAGLADLPRLTPSLPVSRPAAAAVAAAAGLAFAALAIWIASRGAAVPAVDEDIHRWALAHRGPGTIAVARAVRWGGMTTVVLPALIVIGGAAAPRGRGLARRIGSGLLPALVASTGVYAEIWINHAISRARPPVADWAGAASGASFPSGHTTAATLFALCCAWTLAPRARAGWPRHAVWAGAAAYAATVGWSRVWLGVHWPTDVTAGWLFGAAWTAACIAAITVPAVAARPGPGPAAPAQGTAAGQSRPRTRSRQGRPSGS